MKAESDIEIDGKVYKKGSNLPKLFIYPFFLVHMLAFGGSGFFMAYGATDVPILFLYAHGGIAIFVYIMFYLAIFGKDEVKWMFINAALGLLGIYTQIDWLLSFFNKQASDFPFYVHVVPFLYFVLYTFLLRQMLIDITGSRYNEHRQKIVEYCYVFISSGFYLSTLIR